MPGGAGQSIWRGAPDLWFGNGVWRLADAKKRARIALPLTIEQELA